MSERRSRAFSQGILLYLAEKSQMRHQRQQRLNRVTKMFRVPLDEAEPLPTSVSKSPPKKSVVVVQEKPKLATTEVDKQSVQRSLSIASETSSIEEAFRRASLRNRAKSIGCFGNLNSEMIRRRLSAPEVVITSATTNLLLTETKEEELNQEPNKSAQLDRMETLSTLSSPMRLSSSTFKTYSKTTPLLLKRSGSQDSSSVTRRRPVRTDQETIPVDEVMNPVKDPR